MVRILISNPIEQYYGAGAKRYVELACISSDTKPTEGIATGSIAVETDTGTVFFFNEEGNSGSEWVEQFSFQG